MSSITYEDIARVNSEIKKIDIKGKEYAEVPQRVTAFRKLFPNGSLTSEIVYLENGMVVIKATACDGDGNVLATGHAYEKENNGFINKTSYIENCETSAWGRCLSALNLGSDTSMASAEEVLNAQKQQMMMNEDEKRGKLKRLLEETESDTSLFLVWCGKKFMRDVPNIDVLRDKELDLAIAEVERKKEKK